MAFSKTLQSFVIYTLHTHMAKYICERPLTLARWCHAGSQFAVNIVLGACSLELDYPGSLGMCIFVCMCLCVCACACACACVKSIQNSCLLCSCHSWDTLHSTSLRALVLLLCNCVCVCACASVSHQSQQACAAFTGWLV